MELGDALISLEKFGEALTFYQRATELMPNSTLSYLFAKEKVAKTFVKMGDHHNGLHAFTEMANIAEQICKKPATSIYLDILARYDISEMTFWKLFKILEYEIPWNEN